MPIADLSGSIARRSIPLWPNLRPLGSDERTPVGLSRRRKEAADVACPPTAPLVSVDVLVRLDARSRAGLSRTRFHARALRFDEQGAAPGGDDGRPERP